MNKFESFEARCVELMNKGKAELAQLVAAIEHGFSHPDFHPFGGPVPAPAAAVDSPAVAPGEVGEKAEDSA